MARGRERSTPRKMKPVFLVFCEGETEENYLDFIRRQYKSPIKIISRVEGNTISQQLINKRQNELKISKNEQISTFLMYDLDVSLVVSKLKSCKAVWLCSNPCFELWFLLHSKNQTAELTSKKCLQILKKQVDWINYEKHHISESQKKFLWENKSTAIKLAKKLKEAANPSSSVYKLLEDIEKQQKIG